MLMVTKDIENINFIIFIKLFYSFKARIMINSFFTAHAFVENFVIIVWVPETFKGRSLTKNGLNSMAGYYETNLEFPD